MSALRSASARFVAVLAALALLGAGVGLYAHTAGTGPIGPDPGQPTVTGSGSGCCHAEGPSDE